MNFKHISTCVVVLAATFFVSPAAVASQSLRCKSDLVHTGDNKATVLMKCGEPLTKDEFCKPRTKGAVCESVEEWTYNPGAQDFMRTLRFESGRLVSITYGDYGR